MKLLHDRRGTMTPKERLGIGTREGYTISVHSLDRQTGETAVYPSTGYDQRDAPPGTFDAFIWVDGSFSCDCNRALFHDRAHGRETDRPCGRERYRIVKIVRVSDGTTVYQESE